LVIVRKKKTLCLNQKINKRAGLKKYDEKVKSSGKKKHTHLLLYE